jgi:hypothetical protein
MAVPLLSRQREGDRPAAVIGQTMDFRGAIAARRTHTIYCFVW